MGNTYTGTIRPSLSVTLQSDQVFPDNNNVQGTLVELSELPGSMSVDNIFYFNSATAGKYYRRVIDGPVRAMHCGIYPDGADKTTVLNNALAHPEVWEIVFDYSDVVNSSGIPDLNEITISGTVNVPAGKVLTFRNGCKIIGDGTINGGIIDAGDQSILIGPDIEFNPEGSVSDHYSAKWWGATGGGSTNDNAAIQKAFDFIAANQDRAKPIYFPGGDYKLDKGVLFYLFESGEYQQCTIQLRGEFPIQSGVSSKCTKFICTSAMADQFMLGFQRTRTVVVENIYFVGLYNEPSTYTLAEVCNEPVGFWAMTGIRDTQFSPHTCLNIDPFGGDAPADGGYEDWSSYYQGSNTNAGSSQMIIRGCRFERAPVLVACSINGITQQAEIIKWEDCSFGLAKVALAFGQDQTKENLVLNCRVWEATRTIIDCSSYGVGNGAPPYCSGMNIAGAVYSLILCGAPFPFFADQIFAEQLYKIGTIASSATTSAISDSCLDFVVTSTYGIKAQDFIVNGLMNFINCTCRLYGPTGSRLRMGAGVSVITMTNGTISSVPLNSRGAGTNIYDLRNLQNYNVDGSLLSYGNSTPQGFISSWATYHNKIMYPQAKFFMPYGSEGYYEFDYSQAQTETYAHLQSAVVNVGTDGTATVVLSAGSIARLRLNDYLLTDNSVGYTYLDGGTDPSPTLGKITNINTGTNTVTLVEVSVSVPSGTTASIPIYVNYINQFIAPIVCDMTISSNELSHVECVGDFFPAVGTRLEHDFIPLGIYVQSVDTTNSANKKIYLSGNVSGITLANQSIINGRPKISLFVNYNLSVAASYPYLAGAEVIVARSSQYSNQNQRQYINVSKFSTAVSGRPIDFGSVFDGAEKITLTMLKQRQGFANDLYWLTEGGKEGFFLYDSVDTTTANNDATVIVSGYNSRFKRIIEDNFYSAKWFGNANIWFTSTSDATTKIGSAYRYKGLSVLIDISGTPTEYWWFAGTADSNLVPKAGTLLTATATLDFGSTTAQNSADLTVTVTGAAVGDVVALGVPNGSVNAKTCFTAWVSATNTVTVRFNNYSSASVNPASGTFKVSVLK